MDPLTALTYSFALLLFTLSLGGLYHGWEAYKRKHR